MQAARGTSLSPGNDHGPTTTTYVRLFAVVAIAVWLVDQITKFAVVRGLEGEPRSTVIPHVFWLNVTRNAGAAFSTGTGFTLVLSVVAIAVCITVIRLASRLRDRGWAVGLGLLLGGAIGNLTDRLVRDPAPLKGHVIDFLQIPFDFPVFNLADTALTFAALVIIHRTWRGVRLDGTREERR
ncbi:MAG: signal peptidase [Nocardioidaceae bacterium]|jgi:signal peptidase II|nr:signal peptidase [Nocardioidaceae bacterium]